MRETLRLCSGQAMLRASLQLRTGHGFRTYMALRRKGQLSLTPRSVRLVVAVGVHQYQVRPSVVVVVSVLVD